MARAAPALLAFNRGILSRLALARTDLKRSALSAEQQTNWMPRSLGSMMLRPGLQYIAGIRSNLAEKCIPFIFSITDTAIVELTDSTMRVFVSEAVITRASVSSTVTNGSFDSNVTNWTNADESGATSAWATGGYLGLTGTKFNAAIRRQQVTVGVSDRSVEHALRIVIQRGPVTLRVGSSAGAQDYWAETDLDTGSHSIAFTPTGDFHIQFSSRALAQKLVDSCTVESAGAMTVSTPWSASNLSLLRWDQSGDVLFVGCSGKQQRKIQRTGGAASPRSWSCIVYETADGPFRTENLGTTTLAPSATTGDITLTASASLFHSTQVGALFRINSIGQLVTASLTGGAQFTSAILVTAVGSTRNIDISITGVFVATVTLQRSVDNASWSDVVAYTVATTTTYNDTLDNQSIYYRLGIKSAGDYTSGTAVVSLTTSSGSLVGIVRITAYSSETSVSAAVLTELGSTAATADWSEGEWSDYRGWPSAPVLYEGRLAWLGKDHFWLSVSDAFSSFDDTVEGDSGPISRTIGRGAVDTMSWGLGLQRLIGGGGMAEHSARSTSFDEPLTPTSFNLKDASTQGSASVAAVKVDSNGIYVQRSGRRVMLLAYDGEKADYTSVDLTELVPDLGIDSAFTVLAVQRQPDTRIHCVRADGTVAVLLFDPVENLRCWVEVETDGMVEDVFTLPATIEDAVYYVVARTIGGATVRYLERWAREDQCRGQPESRLADAFLYSTGAARTTITGLSHLEGESVVCWGWNTSSPFTVTLPDGTSQTVGRDFGTFTVSGGQITGLSAQVTDAVVGLSYVGQFKSAKLAYGATFGTALTRPKRSAELGLVLADVHASGIEFGADFTTMDSLPDVIEGLEIDANTVFTDLDEGEAAFPGGWDEDLRLCLRATAPRPCTVKAIAVDMETSG